MRKTLVTRLAKLEEQRKPGGRYAPKEERIIRRIQEDLFQELAPEQREEFRKLFRKTLNMTRGEKAEAMARFMRKNPAALWYLEQLNRRAWEEGIRP